MREVISVVTGPCSLRRIVKRNKYETCSTNTAMRNAFLIEFLSENLKRRNYLRYLLCKGEGVDWIYFLQEMVQFCERSDAFKVSINTGNFVTS